MGSAVQTLVFRLQNLGTVPGTCTTHNRCCDRESAGLAVPGLPIDKIEISLSPMPSIGQREIPMEI